MVPIGDGGKKSHAELALGHLHGFPPVLPDPGSQIRLPGHFPGLTNFPGEHLSYKVRHPARIGGAYVIDLHRALPAEGFVVAEKLLRRDGLHLLPGTHLGHTVGVLATEGLQQLLGGIDPLVIELRLDGGDLVDLLPLHKVLQKASVLCRIVEEQLCDEVQCLFQHRFPIQGKPVIHQADIEA